MELVEITGLVKACQFKIFQEVVKKEGKVIAINAKGCGSYSRSQIDELIEFVKGWLLLSQPPGCLRNLTSFTT